MHVHGHTWFTAPIEIPLSQSGSSDGSKCWFCFFFVCTDWVEWTRHIRFPRLCVCVCLDAHASFYPTIQNLFRSRKQIHAAAAVLLYRKKAYNTKSRQFLDNFPLITTFSCTLANISMIHLIRGYTYIISFRLLFIISDEIIFMSRIFHIALEQKMLAEQRNQQHYVEHSIALHMAWRSTFYPLAIIVHHLI